jgi:predicted transcriptional regulator
MNSTKIDVLNCLSDGQWRTTPEVAQACNLSLTNVSELLRRYRSQSLVNRERNYNVPRGYWYRITRVGLERLQYLCSDVIETSSAIADLAGLSGPKKRVLDRWVQQQLKGGQYGRN